MRSSLEWRIYFEDNAGSLLDIPWELGPDLAAGEVSRLKRSICEFQAGESSEGRHLLGLAQEYSAATGDAEYARAAALFIAEEQRHARDLGRVLLTNGVPLLTTTFTDRVFRGLRHMHRKLEVSVGVLVTAEIIAKVYYRALRDATGSAVLRRLCDQILQDEMRHVEFQTDQLSRLRSGRGPSLMMVTMALQRFLFWGTVLVVWAFHRPVIAAGGMGFRDWWRLCWLEFNDAFAGAAPGRSLDEGFAPGAPGAGRGPGRR
jgi:hypothetical protein